MVRPEFWRDRRVLVTGHTGFKGAWLSAWLQRLGARVTGYSLPPVTSPSLYLAARVGDGMSSVAGDLRDLERLSRTVREARPEIVLHLAAQAIVRQSYADPVGTLSTNVMGTVHLLEAVRQYRETKALVIVTSDKCYENRDWLWSYREKSALGGRDPYSVSKACAELVTSAYRKSFFDEGGTTFVASARAGNVIGGGDWADDRLVPDIVRALTEARPVELRHPEAIRPWQHVLDPLAGYLMLAERLHEEGAPFAEAWNFAPKDDDTRTVGWIAERLQAAWGVAPHWRPQAGPRPHEHKFLKLDASKARALLGWEARLAVESTIGWVVDWYREYYDGGDAGELVERQLERYASAIDPAGPRASV